MNGVAGCFPGGVLDHPREREGAAVNRVARCVAGGILDLRPENTETPS